MAQEERNASQDAGHLPRVTSILEGLNKKAVELYVERRPRAWLKVVVLFLAVFVVGGIVGAVAGYNGYNLLIADYLFPRESTPQQGVPTPARTCESRDEVKVAYTVSQSPWRGQEAPLQWEVELQNRGACAWKRRIELRLFLGNGEKPIKWIIRLENPVLPGGRIAIAIQISPEIREDLRSTPAPRWELWVDDLGPQPCYGCPAPYLLP